MLESFWAIVTGDTAPFLKGLLSIYHSEGPHSRWLLRLEPPWFFSVGAESELCTVSWLDQAGQVEDTVSDMNIW